jgi:PiT family inorganic phosphate transporter/sodium-dependent phosphate transporter
VPDYYESEYKSPGNSASLSSSDDLTDKYRNVADSTEIQKAPVHDVPVSESNVNKREQPAHSKDLAKVDTLPWAHPLRLWATLKLVLTYGITRDVIKHQSKGLESGKLLHPYE